MSCQKLAASRTPPGTRQPRPMTAIGSCAARETAARRASAFSNARKARCNGVRSAILSVFDMILFGLLKSSKALRQTSFDLGVAHPTDCGYVDWRPILVHLCGRRGGTNLVCRRQPLAKIAGQRVDRRMIEHQRGRQMRP